MRASRLVVLALACVAAAGEIGDPVRYVRGSPSTADALEQIGGLLNATDAQSMVFVFEQNDFGARQRLQFLHEPDYHAQLAEWLEQIEAMAAKNEGRVRIALTGSSKPLPVRAAPALLQEARRAYDVPPEKWLGRLAHFAKGKNGALVYVAGAPARGFGDARPAWDPEQVATALKRSGARLYVIMPEARFGEFLPTREFVDLPGSWWRVPMARSNRFSGGWADWETECPSAFGFAAYARAAAATGGAYIFYPGRAPDWHDPCPFNVGLLTELVPRLLAAPDVAVAAAADPVLREIGESKRRCAPLGAFESDIAFVPREAGKIVRLGGTARSNADLCTAEAARLAAVGLAAERGELKGATRRSLAQLRYSRFLLEACAFHCASWAAAADTVEAFVARGEGREEYERSGLRIRLWAEEEFDLRQLLTPPPEYPRREEDAIWILGAKKKLEDLPAPLRERAARVVGAAEDVMKHEALSPWGWMVYYSDFVTFAPDWEGESKGERRRHRPDSESKDPETPPEPPPAPGSGGAGPSTGG